MKHLQIFTKALATLMRLLSGQRSQTSSSLKIVYIDKHCSVLYIFKLLKSTWPGFHHTDKHLCVVSLVSLYLANASALRGEHNSSFFISYIAPHKLFYLKPVLSCLVGSRNFRKVQHLHDNLQGRVNTFSNDITL